MYKNKFMTWLDNVFSEALQSSLYTKNGGGFSLDWFLEKKLSVAPISEMLGRDMEPKEVELLPKIVEKHGVEDGLRMIRNAKSISDLQSALKARRTKSAKTARSLHRKSTLPAQDSGRITDYKVASAFDPEALIRRVKVLLENGYEPTGGVSIAVRHDPNVEVLWSQAMVKR